MERNKKSVKRHLLDDLEAGPSGINKKKSKVTVAKSSQQTNHRIIRGGQGKKSSSNKLGTKMVLGNNNNTTVKTVQPVQHAKNATSIKNVVPIIQTRSLKAKLVIARTEIDKLNAIDTLTSTEVADGDELAGDVSHDRIVLSIGSDLEDEFPEHEPPHPEGPEAGEVFSSEEEVTTITAATSNDNGNKVVSRSRVASKVIKVSNPQLNIQSHGSQDTSKFTKFSQLRNDPDFKQFLNEMVNVKLATAKQSEEDLDEQIINDDRKSKSRSKSKPSNERYDCTG